MSEVAEFLLARIAEDYESAQAACRHWERPETWSAERAQSVYDPEDTLIVNGKVLGKVSNVDRGAAAHIARHDPTRVLAECEAKRRIVELGQFSDSPKSAVDFWLEEGKNRTPPQPLGTVVNVFRLLALSYADHADYREEWKP